MIEKSSVVVVSGGARGITATCVIKLAERYQATFILLGRSAIADAEPAWAQGVTDESELQKRVIADIKARGEKPLPVTIQKHLKRVIAQREINDTLNAIRAAGGKAEYLSVDITDGAQLHAALLDAEKRLGKITSIVHGAGNLADKLIENKTLDDFEYVYGAKVEGLKHLLAAVPAQQLKHLVLFSSVAGFYGNTGQSDYAIANEILNKTAYAIKHTHPGCQVISIDWGPWDAGMVSDTLKAYFAERDIELIPLDVGAHMLIDELENNRDQVQIIVGSPLVGDPAPLQPGLHTHRMRRKLTLAANPFLQDHIIGENPVLPMVHALAWMTSVCEDFYPGYKLFACADLKVLKGVVFDNTLPDEFIVDLKEEEKIDGERIELSVKISSQTATQALPRYHYSIGVTLLGKIPPALVYDKVDLTDSKSLSGPELYRNGTLFHGPRFQGVQHVYNISRDKLTMRCIPTEVSQQDQGQFPIRTFNPFLGDAQFQSMLIWCKNIYDAPCLPLSAKGGEQYRPFPKNTPYYVTMEALSSSETGLVTNIISHDENGLVYSMVYGAEVTMSKQLERFFAK